MWQAYYQKPDMTIWQGRADAKAHEYIYQSMQVLDLQLLANELPGIAFLGFCSDVGVVRNYGRKGAAEGPLNLKTHLARLPIHEEAIRYYDAGNIVPMGDDLESAQAALAAAVALLLEKNFFPIVLGGGHETAFGHFQAFRQMRYHTKPITIINFDAHFDLRDIPSNQKGNSGTPFRQIAALCEKEGTIFDYHCVGIQTSGNTRHLFEVAKALDVSYLLAETIHQNAQAMDAFLNPLIEKSEAIYLSICLDVFANAFAPGVSAPQVLGLMPWQVLPALKQIAQSGKLMSVDLVELAPNLDFDQRTGKLGALLLQYLCEHLKYGNLG